MELRDVEEDFDERKEADWKILRRSRRPFRRKLFRFWQWSPFQLRGTAEDEPSNEPDDKAGRNDSIPTNLASGTDKAEQIEDDFN